METITLNADEQIQAKKRIKVNDASKAAMAAGVAGAAVGAAGMSMAEDASNNLDDAQESAEGPVATSDSVVSTVTTNNDTVTEIDPNEVMLEEPVTVPSVDTDVIAQVQSSSNESEEYLPFSNDDPISAIDVLLDPQEGGEMIAENIEQNIGEEDLSIDYICEVGEEGCGMFEDTISPNDELCADNDISYGESDIQSDLMA